MTISYQWLSEYLPIKIDPERMSKILTSIGLEVESMEAYESIKGGLKGLVIGEVLTVEQHPNADKLRLTTVNIGSGEPLQIVCGAPNVAAGQKVIVAPVGSTIYPTTGDPLTMKVAKIRGVESYGMICAEDELGLGNDHSGIMVLPSNLTPGTPAADHFSVYTDWIFEIGLTPNRMDAMSHLGVARDVCAYLTHHDRKDTKVKSPYTSSAIVTNQPSPITVSIENTDACRRYTGIVIKNITVKPSPQWLQDKLVAIGQRPINNIVDITNFILHESGQPLHAFDADKIGGNKVIVCNLPEGTSFVSLDEKERKLSSEDLMICDGNRKPMCIGGVFGGIGSGVSESTKNIFLESAWFNPVSIRKSSFRHGLRTEAAMRFEKNVDISNTLTVLKRAALLIQELGSGTIESEVVDVYPAPPQETEVSLKFHYLKKLSGKNYHPDTIKKILVSLGFSIVKEGLDDVRVLVPTSKPDISLPADIVEEIMRIDGYDNIEIPTAITISPSVEVDGYKQTYKEKVANFLVGKGFFEIFTNSITNSAYFDDNELESAVRLLNNLSVAHNIMRPTLLQTGLEAVAYNLNRKNNNLQLFEFGKSYQTANSGYIEKDHLCLYITGNVAQDSWKQKATLSDVYYAKGVVAAVMSVLGITTYDWKKQSDARLSPGVQLIAEKKVLAELGVVSRTELNRFDIKQPVYFADINWDAILKIVATRKIQFTELPKQLPVQRDLAMVVSKSMEYRLVETTVRSARLERLRDIRLFDIFESEKLGKDKKSLAVSFTFLDEEKTLTDKEIDGMMGKIMSLLEKELNAEIRK
jgi:phenylalanyl-tRNA synthetase beta chain